MSIDINTASPRDLIGYIGERATFRGGVKSAINRVAEAVTPYLELAGKPPMRPGRVYDIWGKEAVPKYWEMDALRAAAARRKEARDEFRKHTERTARIGALVLRRKELRRERLDALYMASRSVDRPMDGRGGAGR